MSDDRLLDVYELSEAQERAERRVARFATFQRDVAEWLEERDILIDELLEPA
jgi:hypothetical protein